MAENKNLPPRVAQPPLLPHFFLQPEPLQEISESV